MSSTSVKCVDVTFWNCFCLKILQNNPLADTCVDCSRFISLEHFLCIMLGDKLDSEISVGWPISKWYAIWTQIHKFINAFWKDFYWLMLLNVSHTIIKALILSFFLFLLSIHTATPSLKDCEQVHIVHTGFAGWKPASNHVWAAELTNLLYCSMNHFLQKDPNVLIVYILH